MTSFAGLRIALVGPLPPPAAGMANQTRQLAELLSVANAAVELVQTNAPYKPAWIARWPGLRALLRLLPYSHSLWKAAGRCDLFHVMANSGWSWHLYAMPAIWIARWRKVPVVVNYRGGEAATFLQRSQTLVRWSMKRAAALVVPSGFLVEVFDRFGMPSKVVPNIVDLSRFHPEGEGCSFGAKLLIARNLESIYDNATGLRALALVLRQRPDASMVVAGTGPQEVELRGLAVSLGVQHRVAFVGRLDRDAMATAYREADISLNASRVDNMPNSVLEAMASGLPVVSTDVGGVPFLVEHGRTGLLVPPCNPELMAEAVLQLLNDTKLAQRLRDNALTEVQRYTWLAVAPRLAAAYRSALSRSSP